MKKCTARYGVWDTAGMHRSFGKWEAKTGWADDIVDNEADEDDYRSDGDVLGDVQDSAVRARRILRSNPSEIPYEEQWETDMDALQPGKVRESC